MHLKYLTHILLLLKTKSPRYKYAFRINEGFFGGADTPSLFY